jgi:hypothetical protein
MKTLATLGMAALLMAALAQPAIAAGNDSGNSVIAEYTHFNNARFSLCRKIIELKARSGEAESECSSELTKSIKQNYAGAVKAARKNGEVSSLLKKYREAMLNALAGIQPLANERVISYGVRQDKAEAEVVQIANRISMEL